MHENPLLPNARLQEMYALMQRCRALSQQTRPASPRLEAIFAASMVHLEEGDICYPLAESKVSSSLAAERLAEHPGALATPMPDTQRLASAAGAALALRLAAKQRITLAYTPTGAASARSEAGWGHLLGYAFHAQLPLILFCIDTPSSARSSKADTLTWTSVSALARKHRLPVLTVDGTDAVAVYRVMQESVNRARQGDGLAIIWCVLPSPTDKTATNDPLRKMKSYLTARDLLPQSAPKKSSQKPHSKLTRSKL